MSFESEYTELQAIVDKLEKGEVGLEDSISQFKKGITLLKGLRKQLEKVENELKVIDVDLEDDHGNDHQDHNVAP